MAGRNAGEYGGSRVTDQTRRALFDNWARQYDQALSNQSGPFPFDGYDGVLSALVELADPAPGSRVLDLGTGTGNLAGRFAKRGCTVWGIDFSETMLARARAKHPELHLVQADLLGAWPSGLPPAFDLVVSAYVLHEFALPHKLRLLTRAADTYLQPGGRILLADIAFPSTTARNAAAQRWPADWDAAEHYWAADETLAAMQGTGLGMHFQQVSSCAGIFRFSKAG